MLNEVVEQTDFWQYYPEGEGPVPGIPIGTYENLYFLKRLVAVSFGHIASRHEWPTILRMLSHNYWVVRNAALKSVDRFGGPSDIALLLKEILADPAVQKEGLIQALCLLDAKESGQKAKPPIEV
jgi:hypothetical protein